MDVCVCLSWLLANSRIFWRMSVCPFVRSKSLAVCLCEKTRPRSLFVFVRRNKTEKKIRQRTDFPRQEKCVFSFCFPFIFGARSWLGCRWKEEGGIAWRSLHGLIGQRIHMRTCIHPFFFIFNQRYFTPVLVFLPFIIISCLQSRHQCHSVTNVYHYRSVSQFCRCCVPELFNSHAHSIREVAPS